jgi:RluA family pseudouridine synthase
MTGVLTEADRAFARSLLIAEDDAVMAFNKPAGLSSQGGRIKANTLDDLLAAFARSNGKRPRLVHRLDRDTSGVILAAKTQPAAAFLGKALMSRRVRKTYLAIVGPGAPAPPGGEIDTFLCRREIGREAYMQVCEAGASGAQQATTHYRTLHANGRAALVELHPRTGRMHQLRVHMAYLGRPILGDARYGGALALDNVTIPRLMLHAAAIIIPHPNSGEKRYAAPLPKDFQAVLESLGLGSAQGD